jgi:hypothetical protein
MRRHYTTVYVETLTPEGVSPDEIRSTIIDAIRGLELRSHDGARLGSIDHAQVSEGVRPLR